MDNLPKNYQEIILVNEDYFNSLIKDINTAKTSIDMEAYIFAEDKMGNRVANALIDAAKRGVHVRLLIDGIGSRNLSHLWDKMEQGGVKLKIYHPLFFSIFKFPFTISQLKNIFHHVWYLNLRNHRKTCTIDKSILYIGSANIIETSLVNPKNQKWHDITVKTKGLNLDDMEFAFNKVWGSVSLEKRVSFMLKKMDKDPTLRLNFSWRRRRNLYKSLLRNIKNSQNRILITNAYFVPRKFLLVSIIKAAKRGVKVSIILSKNTDVVGISLLMSVFYKTLLNAGVKIFHYASGILHIKFLIIDDWYCVGSSNFNYRSINYDLEVDLKLQTPSAKKELENIFYEYQENSAEVNLQDLKKPSFFERIAIKFLLLIRFLF